MSLCDVIEGNATSPLASCLVVALPRVHLVVLLPNVHKLSISFSWKSGCKHRTKKISRTVCVF